MLGEANCISGLGDIARDRSDPDGAQTRYEQALQLYQQIRALLGQADYIKGLGDLARDRSDPDGARVRYEQALLLYQAIQASYPLGWTFVRLARLDASDSERARHWTAAREAWASIGRDDLIESIKAEFE